MTVVAALADRLENVYACLFSVLSEGVAKSLRQPAGSGIQRERRASYARDDVSEVRQAALVRGAN